MNKKMEKVKWYEKIGFFDILSIFIHGWQKTTMLYYDSEQCRPLVQRLISAIGIKKAIPADFKGMGPGADGKTIIYQLYDMLAEFQEFVALRQASHQDPIVNASAKCYIAQYLFYETFSFVHMVLCDSRYEQGQVIVLNSHPFQFQYLLRDFFTRKGIVVQCDFCFSKTVKFSIRPIIYLCFAFMATLRTKVRHSKGMGERPSIWVEYVHNSIVDYSSWFRHLPAHCYDVVYYLDRSDPYPVSFMTNSIEEEGLKWIDIRSWRNFRSIPLSFGFGLVFRLFNSGSTPWWYRIFLFEYYYRYRLYHNFFIQYQVKILTQHGEASWIQGPQAAALRDTGGVMVGYHWSNYQAEMPLGTHFFPQTIFFVWGQWMSRVMGRQNHLCKYILPIGPMGIHPPSAKDISSEIINSQFLIGVFDSSVAYNIEQTPETLVSFYDIVLGLLENHSSWRAIIKSKSYSSAECFKQLPGGASLFERIFKLEKCSKLVLASNTVSPLAVACKANLSICFGLNSAGILAGIHGYRAIHWDCAGWLDFPVYKNPQQKILYTDLRQFQNAILDAFHGDTTVGDFSVWRHLRLLNYFDDLGEQRIAEFFHDLMNQLSNTHDTEVALNRCVREYLDRNSVTLGNPIE